MGTLGYDGRPIGRYKGNPSFPDVCAGVLKGFFSNLLAPAPLARLSTSHDPIGTYYGLDIIPPQRFPLGPPAANRDADFEGVAFQEITWEP
ncbi:MAG TPA: hypothetical protein VG348_15905 [Acidimicrobiia bacterium]|jgi:hypothetical protein|nr:hypothetical protein [Acidimicrobiia bacterium]